MLQVLFEKKKINIRFRHNICQPYEIESLTGLCVNGDRRCSFVTVEIDSKPFGKGVVVCHPSDNFCKSRGRKKALSYAISSLHRVIRKKIWEEYGDNIGF